MILYGRGNKYGLSIDSRVKKALFPLTLLYCAVIFGQPSEEKVKVKIKPPGAPEESARTYTAKGTVYLKEDFKKGFTLINGHEHLEVDLRYDGYRDDIEILDRHGEILILKKTPNIGAKFDNRTFLYIDYFDHGEIKKGFFEIRHDGNTKLYLKYRKKIFWSNPDHGYEQFVPPHFVLEEAYYLQRENREAKPLAHLSRKEVFAVLWEKYSELRKYARKNKLQMRTEEEVIQVLNYYDSLQ